MGRFLSHLCVSLFSFLFDWCLPLKPLIFLVVPTILFSNGISSRDCCYQNILNFSTIFVNFLKLKV